MPSKPFPPRVSISGSPSPTTRAARNAQRRRSVVPSRSRLLRGAACGRWRGASGPAPAGAPRGGRRAAVAEGSYTGEACARGRTRVAGGAARNPGRAARAGRARAWLGVASDPAPAGAPRGGRWGAEEPGLAEPGSPAAWGQCAWRGRSRPAGATTVLRRGSATTEYEPARRDARLHHPPTPTAAPRAPPPRGGRAARGELTSRDERGVREGRAEGAEKGTADYGTRTMRRTRQ